SNPAVAMGRSLTDPRGQTLGFGHHLRLKSYRRREVVMVERIDNFSAGPAVLPVEVLQQAGEDLLSLGASGIGILEHSHRGKAFLAVYEDAVARIRRVAAVPDDYEVLFLQGGASTQFFMLPANFLAKDR